MIRPEAINAFSPWALILVAAVALGTAYTAEFGFGYDPCVLCLYQRIPYATLVLLGAVGVVFPAARAGVMALAGLTLAVGAGIAFYHVGVEQTWWTSAAPCGASGVAITTTQDLLAALQQKPEKSCGDIDWTLFGISMATYNAVVSAALALVALWAWRRIGTEPTR